MCILRSNYPLALGVLAVNNETVIMVDVYLSSHVL